MGLIGAPLSACMQPYSVSKHRKPATVDLAAGMGDPWLCVDSGSLGQYVSLYVISGWSPNRIIAVCCHGLHLYRKRSSQLSGVVTLYISPLSLSPPSPPSVPPSLSLSLCMGVSGELGVLPVCLPEAWSEGRAAVWFRGPSGSV